MLATSDGSYLIIYLLVIAATQKMSSAIIIYISCLGPKITSLRQSCHRRLSRVELLK